MPQEPGSPEEEESKEKKSASQKSSSKKETSRRDGKEKKDRGATRVRGLGVCSLFSMCLQMKIKGSWQRTSGFEV